MDRADYSTSDEANCKQSRHYKAAHAARVTPHLRYSLDPQKRIYPRASRNPRTRPLKHNRNLFEYEPRTYTARVSIEVVNFNEIEMTPLVVAAISSVFGLIGGAITSLAAPWVHWGIEKRRDKMNRRPQSN